jgi:hypothetical protein
MNKTELWNALIERYPEFADEEYIVKQRARGLHRLLDQAWDEGAASVRQTERAKEDILSRMFGKFKQP